MEENIIIKLSNIAIDKERLISTLTNAGYDVVDVIINKKPEIKTGTYIKLSADFIFCEDLIRGTNIFPAVTIRQGTSGLVNDITDTMATVYIDNPIEIKGFNMETQNEVTDEVEIGYIEVPIDKIQY